jgi:hypothetical protein
MNVFGPAAILCLGAGRYARYLSLLRILKGRTSYSISEDHENRFRRRNAEDYEHAAAITLTADTSM